MVSCLNCSFALCAFLLSSIFFASAATGGKKSASFLSPKIHLTPGSVANKLFFDVEFPKGHIAIKGFHGEVVDQEGNSVPLTEAYLHHWVLVRYYQRKGTSISSANYLNSTQNKDLIFPAYGAWGTGSESRKTSADFPDPYGIEAGNTTLIPRGYTEKWLLNVHTIDTRGVVNKLGCLECRCDLYNVTADEDGKPLPRDYKGGMKCCSDAYQCRLRKGFKGVEREIHMRYTVKWVEWDSTVFLATLLTFDVTDLGKGSGGQLEYSIRRACGHKRRGDDCIVKNSTTLVVPKGGYLLYAVGHQHIGGCGITLFGQDGRAGYTSKPIYGRGKETGNEKGYVVGMSTWYPKIGAVKIMDKEEVRVESTYSGIKAHTGVMGIFYMLIAERLPT